MTSVFRERLRAVRGWVLRRPHPMEPLTRRSWLLDIGLALGLTLVSILDHHSADDADVKRFQGPGYVGPPPPYPGGDPSQLVDQPSNWDFAGSALLLALIAASLVLRRRYPLSVLWAVMLMATMVTDHPEALRLSFYVCVIAAYSAAVYSPYRIPALLSLPVAAFLM